MFIVTEINKKFFENLYYLTRILNNNKIVIPELFNHTPQDIQYMDFETLQRIYDKCLDIIVKIYITNEKNRWDKSSVTIEGNFLNIFYGKHEVFVTVMDILLFY